MGEDRLFGPLCTRTRLRRAGGICLGGDRLGRWTGWFFCFLFTVFFVSVLFGWEVVGVVLPCFYLRLFGLVGFLLVVGGDTLHAFELGMDTSFSCCLISFAMARAERWPQVALKASRSRSLAVSLVPKSHVHRFMVFFKGKNQKASFQILRRKAQAPHLPA